MVPRPHPPLSGSRGNQALSNLLGLSELCRRLSGSDTDGSLFATPNGLVITHSSRSERRGLDRFPDLSGNLAPLWQGEGGVELEPDT